MNLYISVTMVWHHGVRTGLGQADPGPKTNICGAGLTWLAAIASAKKSLPLNQIHVWELVCIRLKKAFVFSIMQLFQSNGRPSLAQWIPTVPAPAVRNL